MAVGNAHHIYEYNPQKAGAEILKTVNVHRGKFADYTNNHFYIVDSDKVGIFDITNDETCDKMNIIKSIQFNVRTLYADITSDNYFLSSIEGIFDCDNQIVIHWTAASQYQAAIQIQDTVESVTRYKYREDFVKLDYDGTLTFSDLSIDLPGGVTHLHYDNQTQYLYTNKRVSYTQNGNVVLRYKYSQQSKTFEKDKDFSNIIYPNVISNEGVFVNETGFAFYNSNGQMGDCYATIYVYSDYENPNYKTVNTNYLNLKNIPDSILFDGNHFWIYYHRFLSNDYKLIEINVL